MSAVLSFAYPVEDELERLRALIDGTTDIIYESDERGFFTFVNAAAEAILGYPPATLVGKHSTELIREDWREVTRAYHKKQLHSSLPTASFEFPVVAADGRTVWMSQNVQAVFCDGRITGFRAIARDVTNRTTLTDRIQLERDLLAARDAALDSARQKSQFLANMSHEIRTPMNGVLGLLGILADTPLNADQADLVQTARGSAESLLSILNDILDFSKIEAGKLSFEVVDFDVRAACESVIDLLADSARKKGLEIGCVVDPDIPPGLLGDSGRLRQVLLNLVGNAIKFTAEGGVLIQVERDSDAPDGRISLRFRITDTGIGIPADVQDRLFHPFVQADESSSRRFGGTGLGLAISKQLVQMMEGDIGVESEPGCGCSFWFTARFGASDAAIESSPTPSRLPRVLIVEDSTTTRQMVALQLTAWRVPNETTDSSFAAVAMMRDAVKAGTPFDVVISDLNMPEMDGVGLARIARSNSALGTPRFVLMTGATTSFDAAALASAGVTTALRKPLKPQHLFAALFAGDAVAPRPVPKKMTNPQPAVTSARRRILVADDSIINQKVAVRQLEKMGYAADAVANGLEALDALQRIAYDLVLMDCQMPEMDGYEATAGIREREKGRSSKTPIVALTASASDSDRTRCLDAGMNDFVSKPVREKDLATVLERWLS